MDARLLRSITKAVDGEVIRRLLTEYFKTKEVKLNSPIQPNLIADLPQMVPQLASKVEVIPNAEDIDPATGAIKLEWNLFVLGNIRLNLGQSTHANINEITAPTQKEFVELETCKTPKIIIEFIVKHLSNCKAGNLFGGPQTAAQPAGCFHLGITDNSGFYRHGRSPIY